MERRHQVQRTSHEPVLQEGNAANEVVYKSGCQSPNWRPDFFQNCTKMTSVTIGNSVTTIEEFAFFNCSALSSIIIPNSVKTIGGAAFADCSALTSVIIGNSVTSIGSSAFNSV